MSDLAPLNHGLLKNLPALIVQFDVAGRLVFATDAFLVKLGYTEQNLAELTTESLMNREMRQYIDRKIAASSANEACLQFPCEMDTASKQSVSFDMTATVEYDTKGEVVSWVGQLLESEDSDSLNSASSFDEFKHKFVLDAAGIGVWDWNIPDNKLVWDEQMYKVYGISPAKFSSAYEAWYNGVHEEDREKSDLEVKEALEKTSRFDTKFRVVKESGEVCHVRAKGRVIRDSSGNPVRMLGLNWDITKEIEAQEALSHASKFAALGVMSSGVAHEINNPLTIIGGYANRLLRRLTDRSYVETNGPKDLAKILDTVQRIGHIVQAMRRYSGDGSKQQRELVDLQQIIDDSLVFCRERLSNHGVTLRLPDRFKMYVEAHPIELSQVILNLLSNAFDAAVEGTEKWIQIGVEQDRAMGTIISVIDSGIGISDKDRHKIMDPFFTTKQIGKGTGLGLSISRGIVEDHNGQLVCDSIQGHTRFRVILPSSVAKVAEAL